MIKKLAIIFGAVFLLIGILGYIPALTPSGMLFGVFAVDAMHNAVHLITGAVALAVGLSNERASMVYFQVFGIIYAIITVLGLARGNAPVLGMAHNVADIWLHLVTALVALYIGFVQSHLHWHTPHWRH